MVFPSPAADPGAVEARAWLDKLVQPLELSREGILLCLRDATPTQLGPVVRALSGAPPWAEGGEVLEVCLRATEVLEAPPGSRVLLRVRTEDLDWLNIARPLFAERRLRTILWADAEALEGLVRRAVDFFDWVSRVVSVPSKAVADFAVDGMRAALSVGAEVAWDGDGLFETLGAAGYERFIELHAEEPYLHLIASLRGEGVPVVSGVRSIRDAWRLRIALAEVGRHGSWIALDPAEPMPGFQCVHARQVDWDDATATLRAAGWSRPALMAAWLDLNPSQIQDAVSRFDSAPVPATATATVAHDLSESRDALRDDVARIIEAEVSATESLLELLTADGATEDANALMREWSRRSRVLGAPLPATAGNWQRTLETKLGAAKPSDAEILAIRHDARKRDDSDWELLERWGAGERAAANELIERYYPQMHVYVAARMPTPDAEDVVQEIFAKLSESSKRRGLMRTTSFRAHLFRIAQHVVRQELRHRYYRSTESYDSENDLSSTVADRDQLELLLKAFRHISLDHQDILDLYYFQGLSSPELAVIFEVSESTIRSRLHAARRTLRRVFQTLTSQTEIDLDAQLADLDTRLRAARAQVAPTSQS